MKIADITDGEVVKSELHNRQRVVTQGFDKKNKPFKDQSKIVTEEFDPELNTVPEESSMMLNMTSKDLECFQQYKVDKAKPGFLAQPSSDLRKHLPTGLIV